MSSIINEFPKSNIVWYFDYPKIVLKNIDIEKRPEMYSSLFSISIFIIEMEGFEPSAHILATKNDVIN